MPNLALATVPRPVVPRCWPGQTVVCLGGGPSLTAADVRACRGRARVVAINDAYRLAPWAEVLYGADARWWAWHQGVVGFPGLKYALEPAAARWPGVTVLANTGEDGLEADPSGLRTGRNSGYSAINLAVHLGAARIVLLGYDLQPGPRQQQHWFGDHPNHSRSPYGSFRALFAGLVAPLAARGVSVLNSSRVTALTCFPRAPLEEALACRPA